MLLTVALYVIKGLCLVGIVGAYLYRRRFPHCFTRVLRLCFIILLALSVIAPASQSVLQYTLFAHHPVSVFLLPPHRSITYFLFYVWGRFWLSTALSFASTGILYGLLRIIVCVFPDRFDYGEDMVIALIAFIVGWPSVVLLVPFGLFLTILTTLFQRTFLRRYTVHIVDGFFIAGIILFLFGGPAIALIGLSALIV